MKEFKVYRRVIESMTRLDLAENPIGTPQPRQPQQPRQPLQEYEVPVEGKYGRYYRRQRVKQYRPNYRPVGSSAQTPTAPQPQAQPQTPTAQRRPTEQELAIPRQPSQEFLSRVAKRTPTPEETQQTTMEMIAKGTLPSGGQQTSGQGAQTTQGQGAAIAPEETKKKLEDLHKAYIDEAGSETEIMTHPKGHASYHAGLYENTAWGIAPKYPTALATIEDALGHPMLLGGLLTAAAGFPAYLETRAGYGKTTMAHALKQRIDSLYERAEKGDREAARELVELPFADVVVIEPKSEIAELIGYLYVAPNRERSHDPSVVNNLAKFLMTEGRAETMEEAMELANDLLDESVDWMTGGSISGTTAIAPTEEIATALERAALWRMPNGKMAKPIAIVYDDAHTEAFWRMLQARMKTALAANTMYGMPYVRVSHLLFANPNDLNASSEFASRLMPWITPADVTAEYGVRGTPTVSELIRAEGRKIAKAALRKVLGQSIDEIGDISKVLKDENVVQKLREQFDEEIRERLGHYGVLPHEVEELRKLPADAYLTGDLGMPPYMDAIATAVSQAGLDALTAGWHYRPIDEVDVEHIYSQYAGTPGFKAAYTNDELREVAERHAAFATAVHRNIALATQIFSGKFEIPDWNRVLAFINQHLSSRAEKINWFNERAAANKQRPVKVGPDRTPRDWQRFTRLTALFGAMGRPDMVAYTIGAIGGINPEVSMPKITVNDPPAEIEKKLDAYFTADNLSPSVQAMLQGQQLTPAEYAEGLKQYARALIFTTQTDGSAGAHTIYSILEPHVNKILQHGGSGVSTAPLAYQITRDRILPSDHTKTSIYEEAQPSGQQGGQQKRSVQWYEAHEADFNKLLDGSYRNYLPKQITDAHIQQNAEAAHTTLSILAGLMHSMHATVARGSQERNAILRSAKHARRNLTSQEDAPLLQHVRAVARMAAALGRYAEKGRYEDLSDEDKKELHKFAHQVAFAFQRKDENGNPAVSDDVKDLVETVHGIATSGSQAKTGASATGVGPFTPLSEKKWNPDFADTLAKVLTS